MKKGTILYRGSSNEARNATSYINKEPNYLKNKPHVYFSNSEKNVSTYGRAVKYITTTELLKMVNMGNVKQVEALMNLAKNTPSIVNNIKGSFPIINNEVKRSSEKKRNNRVSAFICKQGKNGYYAPRLRTTLKNGYFHPEVVLCNPTKVLKVVNVQNISEAPPPRAPTKSRRPIRF
jgi:hypothetical protein